MTQEEKKLLLADLCARLPYYTMVLMDDGGVELLVSVNVDTGICNGLKGLPKPYLRPMSSMTEEEKKEYHKKVDIDLDRTAEVLREQFETGTFHPENRFTPQYCHIDWLNANHFDYHGLIHMGLALEAPEDMYKIE